MISKKNYLLTLTFLLVYSFGLTSFAINNTSATVTNQEKMIVKTPEGISWSPGPKSLPKGAMMSVLSGDPTQSGPFTLRLKLPPNYKIPAHYHPVMENVTVIKGTFYIGSGDKLDTTKGNKLTVGGFAAMPPKMHHFAYTLGDGATIQLHGLGPWRIIYINPANDPRGN